MAGCAVIRAQPIHFSVLHSFTAGFSDGASPYSEVNLGSDGVLYGTTWSGGSAAGGVVFRMNRDGSGFAILHHFGNADDGSAPDDGVIQASDGFLYGTTYFGGTDNGGTIYRLSTNGSSYSILHRFTNSPDGANPYAGLIQGQDGALYGTTYGGGSGPGTVFKIDMDGNHCEVLHSFQNFVDATQPFGRLAQGNNGMLYGTTYAGGPYVIGTVFQIDTNGLNYSVLHSFDGAMDGFSPECGLLVGLDGWLYGTTVSGGNLSSGRGTVFKLNTNGSGFAVLHTFTNSPDGAYSYGRMVQGDDGYLYGVTSWGGNTNSGTIFRVNTNGASYSVLHHFHGDDGSQPWAGFTVGNGVFYGTALMGGAGGFGTVYRFALPPTLNFNFANPSGPLLTLTGLPNQSCQIQVSSDLIHWSFLTNTVLANGSTQVLDANATNAYARYYRAVVP